MGESNGGKARRGPRPTDAEGYRSAWANSERMWQQTMDSASPLPPVLLHERVNGEWSFIETLRHLLFVTDAWVSRAILGVRAPYHPLDLPPTGMKNPAIPCDLEARPSLEEVLILREERLTVVREVMTRLSDEALDGQTERIHGPGYPRAGSYATRRCLLTVVNEEWHHRLYAERDLAVLQDRAGVAADRRCRAQ
jgi:hypothetical protein